MFSKFIAYLWDFSLFLSYSHHHFWSSLCLSSVESSSFGVACFVFSFFSIGRSFYLLGKDVFLFSHFWVCLVIGSHFSLDFERRFFCLLRVQCAFKKPHAVLFTIFFRLWTMCHGISFSLVRLVLIGPFQIVDSFSSVFFSFSVLFSYSFWNS